MRTSLMPTLIERRSAALAAAPWACRLQPVAGADRPYIREFAAGFAHTTSVRLTTGRPSRIEGAAGWRYVEVPVSIVAITDNGRAQSFDGTYTLRRTVGGGASPSERQWHLDRASIRDIAP
jgi:hypothetical protein